MNKKLQVFVSSTYTDLIEERQEAVKAILDAGHIPAGMELFKPGSESQLETIYKWINESDVYMLILGGRYGSIEAKSNKSYTQLEYEYAISKNIPFFAIVLSEEYLETKVASLGQSNVKEQNAPDKYKTFRSLVMSKTVRIVNDYKDIKIAILSKLNEFSASPNLIGWIKSNQINTNFNYLETDILKEHMNKIINELFNRSNKIENTSYTSKFTEQILNILNANAILESSHKTVDLELLDDGNNIKVTTATTNRFSFIKDNERYFYLYTQTTKQQADSFKVETVQINGIDYTSQVLLSKTNIPNRGQFTYIVQSDFIPPNLSSCDLYYVTSYVCPALDFFQSHKLSYPCNNFTVSVTIKNDIKNLYTILGSTFSSFSILQYDDYKASEIHKFSTCTMTLPTWSLPGAGYATTLKNKTPNNHI